jgi:hypothetical protein
MMTSSSDIDKDKNQEYWSMHIKQWQESKLSQKTYCTEVGIKYGTFVYWRGLLREKSSHQLKSFVPVKILPQKEKVRTSDSVIQVKLLSGHVVMIPTTLDIKNIATLIKCLGDSDA